MVTYSSFHANSKLISEVY